MTERWFWATVLGLLAGLAVIALPGCGSIKQAVARSMADAMTSRVVAKAEKAEKAAAAAVDVAKKAEKKVVGLEKKLSAAAKKVSGDFPLLAVVGILLVGGLLTAGCAWKFPSAVDVVIIGTCGLAMVVIVRVYLLDVVVTTAVLSGVAAGGLVGWKLLRRYVLPRLAKRKGAKR